MVDNAQIGIERRRDGKWSNKVLIASLLLGIGIGYAICCIQSWLFA
jgi:hypothetical protein